MSTTARQDRLPRRGELPVGYVVQGSKMRRDVEALGGGFRTNRETEQRRLSIQEQAHQEILERLVGLIQTPGCIISRHPRLSVRSGKGWALPKRRRSFQNMLFLNEHSTTDNLLELLRQGMISRRLLRNFMQKTPKLSETARGRIERALEEYQKGSRAADSAAFLLEALQTPDEWIRLSVQDMIIDARENGMLIRLYLENRITDDDIGKLQEAGLVGDAFMARLQEAVEKWLDPTTHAKMFDTGELMRLLDEEPAKVGRS